MSRSPRTKALVAEPSFGTTLDFLRLLWALDHALQKRSKRLAVKRGITGPQRFALRMIDHAPGIGAGALARALKMHPSTLTGVLRRLERAGLITRQSVSGDQRRATLVLTRAGRTKVRNRTGTIEQSVSAVLGRTPAAELKRVSTFLQTLVAAIDPDQD